MGKELYTAKQFIDAIPGTGGIVSTIAKRVGCTWHTAQKYISEYATIQQAYQDECEAVSDMAESILITSMKEGNSQDAKWWLSRIRAGKFAEKKDINLSNQDGDVFKIVVRIKEDAD